MTGDRGKTLGRQPFLDKGSIAVQENEGWRMNPVWPGKLESPAVVCTRQEGMWVQRGRAHGAQRCVLPALKEVQQRAVIPSVLSRSITFIPETGSGPALRGRCSQFQTCVLTLLALHLRSLRCAQAVRGEKRRQTLVKQLQLKPRIRASGACPACQRRREVSSN